MSRQKAFVNPIAVENMCNQKKYKSTHSHTQCKYNTQNPTVVNYFCKLAMLRKFHSLMPVMNTFGAVYNKSWGAGSTLPIFQAFQISVVMIVMRLSTKLHYTSTGWSIFCFIFHEKLIKQTIQLKSLSLLMQQSERI